MSEATDTSGTTEDEVQLLARHEVVNNLTKNFRVNRGNLNAGVIDIASVSPNLFIPKPVRLPPQIGPIGSSGWVCDPTAQYGPAIGISAAPGGGVGVMVDSLRAWMTDTEGNVPVLASRSLIRGTSVDEFEQAVPDGTHFRQLQDFCFFLVTNGSGTGACSCGSGDNFSKAPQPPPIVSGP